MKDTITEERQARKQDQFLTSLIEHVSQPMMIASEDKRLFLWNAAFSKLIGYTDKELCDPIISAGITAPEWHEGEIQALEKLQRTGQTQTFQKEYIRKDGTRVPVEVLVYHVTGDAGKIKYYVGLITDITERKQLEEALQKSERHYRVLVENAIEGIVVTQDGKIKFVNPIVTVGSGYSAEELQSMSLKDLVYPENEEVIVEGLSKAAVPGTLRIATPFKIRTKGGEIRWVEATITSIMWDDKAANLNLLRDITERKAAEEVLIKSEERYRTAIEEMEESYYEVDLAGNFIYFNDALCRHLGYSREEMAGINYRVYTPREDIKKMFETYNQVYRTGEPLKWLPMENIRKDGTRIFTENSVFPLRDEGGKIIGFRGVGRDVTEHKRAEEERRQLEQKAQLASRLASVGELASGVAHEINNPLTGVIGYANLLLARNDIPKDMIRDVEAINEGAQRVSNIVKKLLAFAQQTRPEQRYVNINEIILNTLDLQAYALAANNIKVNLQLTRDLPTTIADPAQLQQVFLNLIMNAQTEMKSTRKSGKLSIKTEHADNIIRVYLKDNGPGITKENMDNIFNPFFTTREVGQGAGLGLSLCHGIITEHKGRIWAESEPGRGATFIIELPVVTEDEQMEATEPIIVKESKKAAKAKILVVDDEPVVRQLVSQVLTDEGHGVETADNAADALAMVKNNRYRLILLDIKMPGMSGIELYKQFQKIAPSLTKRVVFITGDIMGKRTIDFLDNTKALCIMKPFDAKQLKAEIKRILARR